MSARMSSGLSARSVQRASSVTKPAVMYSTSAGVRGTEARMAPGAYRFRGPADSLERVRTPGELATDLVARPRRDEFIVAEFPPGIVNGERPIDRAPFVFCRASPGA